jgi:membrane protein DedA with SNARE-associated domain
MHWVSETIRYYLSHWGYWAIVIGILGENAGLPLPGEAVLMAASFLAKKGQLQLDFVIPIAIVAATLGDNAGYWVGHKLGRPVLRRIGAIVHLDQQDLSVAQDLIRRRGGRTIFFARFIFGLRTIAGLLAGTLDMEWRRFFLCNALGAATWATAMSLVGFAFGARLNNFEQYFEYASWALGAALFAMGYWVWRRYKKQFANRATSPCT